MLFWQAIDAFYNCGCADILAHCVLHDLTTIDSYLSQLASAYKATQYPKYKRKMQLILLALFVAYSKKETVFKFTHGNSHVDFEALKTQKLDNDDAVQSLKENIYDFLTGVKKYKDVDLNLCPSLLASIKSNIVDVLYAIVASFTADCAIQNKVIRHTSRYSDEAKYRVFKGYATYGTLLQPHNGRDCLQDLKEELLDACFYLAQAIEEGKKEDAKVLIDRFYDAMFNILQENIDDYLDAVPAPPPVVDG